MPDRHNGWPNYETDRAHHWFTDDVETYDRWTDRATQHARESMRRPESDRKVFDAREFAMFSLSEELKEDVEEFKEGVDADIQTQIPSLLSELLDSALSKVNWEAIATEFLSEIDWDAIAKETADE